MYTLSTSTVISERQTDRVSNLVFYAQSTFVVISGRRERERGGGGETSIVCTNVDRITIKIFADFVRFQAHLLVVLGSPLSKTKACFNALRLAHLPAART